MNTLSVLTLHLAQAIGLYLILIGLSGLAAPQRWEAMMRELAGSAALQMAIGLPVFAIGVTLVLVHYSFHDPLAAIVSIVGIVALIEGALLIAVPGPLMHLGFLALDFTRAWAIVSLILGILLGYAGLAGHAGHPHIV
ncbi:DUF2065 family protein [Sphingobium nicotianae]|uniref:DUF2065 family protein n=1 Tax=Sphingobium nicotianae TaxID=2782607 RepID=A0A9X1DAU0_9SPHN|nr:DUF2065 family protein [Sphingobium nicotianae]MBT2186581.1 DUF2065 family protein [Sphingobium nicotianae]